VIGSPQTSRLRHIHGQPWDTHDLAFVAAVRSRIVTEQHHKRHWTD
jgi:hypothetical protein